MFFIIQDIVDHFRYMCISKKIALRISLTILNIKRYLEIWQMSRYISEVQIVLDTIGLI